MRPATSPCCMCCLVPSHQSPSVYTSASPIIKYGHCYMYIVGYTLTQDIFMVKISRRRAGTSTRNNNASLDTVQCSDLIAKADFRRCFIFIFLFKEMSSLSVLCYHDWRMSTCCEFNIFMVQLMGCYHDIVNLLVHVNFVTLLRMSTCDFFY